MNSTPSFVAPPREPVPPTPLSSLLDMRHGVESIEAERLSQWQSRGVPILDLRPPSHFDRWRLRGRASNVPWYLLADEGFLLPPREVALAVHLPQPSANTEALSSNFAADQAGPISFQQLAAVAASEMTGSGLAEPTVAPTVESVLGAFLGPRNPWVVTDVFVDSPSLQKAARIIGLADDTNPSAASVHHLWSPTPELLAAVDKIEATVAMKGRGSSSSAETLSSPSPAAPVAACRGSCLDLGCGAGRDSSFLALRGWRVLATDNMPKALARARKLATRCGVGSGSSLDGKDDFNSTSTSSTSNNLLSHYNGSLATAVVDVRKDPGSVARALAAADNYRCNNMCSSASSSDGPICHLEVRAPLSVSTNASEADSSCASKDAGGISAHDEKSDDLHNRSKRLRSQELTGSGELGSFDRGVDLLVIGRFFYRPLLEALSEDSANGSSLVSSSVASKEMLLTARELVAPGGLVFWHHFRDGCQHHPLGHPSSDADIVRPGELMEAFAGWEVLLNDEEAFLPDGRPMVTFIAQRPLKG